MRDVLARERGWTYEQIDDMTFEQIGQASRHGKPHEGIPIESEDEAREIARNWRKYMGV